MARRDYLWQEGTTYGQAYGATDGPGDHLWKPYLHVAGGPPAAINVSTDGPGGPILGTCNLVHDHAMPGQDTYKLSGWRLCLCQFLECLISELVEVR